MRAIAIATLLLALIGLGGCAGWYAAGDMGGGVGGHDDHRDRMGLANDRQVLDRRQI